MVLRPEAEGPSEPAAFESGYPFASIRGFSPRGHAAKEIPGFTPVLHFGHFETVKPVEILDFSLGKRLFFADLGMSRRDKHRS